MDSTKCYSCGIHVVKWNIVLSSVVQGLIESAILRLVRCLEIILGINHPEEIDFDETLRILNAISVAKTATSLLIVLNGQMEIKVEMSVYQR